MKDEKKALKCFKKAADEGKIVQAIQMVGSFYQKGIGTEQNYEKAFEYFKRGAALNHPNSYDSLGFLYLNGQHVEKDLDKALENFDKAFELGHPPSKKMIDFINKKKNQDDLFL